MSSYYSISTLLLLATILYTVYGAIYRLCFSPIARFPGNKLAALTLWYELYYDVIKRGTYTWEIKKMHEKYGPIIRINPYELHVSDPAFADKLYPAMGKKVEKWPWSARMLGNHDSAFGTVKHCLHRRRRAAFSNFFSKASVRRLEPRIQLLVDKLCDKLEAKANTGEPINLVHAFAALSQDVITEYCFAKCSNILDTEDFSPEHYERIQRPAQLTHLIKQFPSTITILINTPLQLLQCISPTAAQMRLRMAGVATLIKSILSDVSAPASGGHRSIFHTLHADPNLPASEKTVSRLAAEARAITAAGTLTTAHTLSTTVYHILANPPVLARLLDELEDAIPNPAKMASWQELEKLPYLTAVVYEGLRVSYGIAGRLPRVHPDTALFYGDWIIPSGTPTSMTISYTNDNPAIFPSPSTFSPDRWLHPPPPSTCSSSSPSPTIHLANFGRGTRNCVGMHLAYAEIYIALAAVVRRFGGEEGGMKMRLWDTEFERDVRCKKDFFVVSPGEEGRGVRVLIGSKEGKE